MENEIPICGDGWLAVFDLIAPRQLGLEIALLSHRFDYYVEEHFKTRKWTLGEMKIECKKGKNGTKEMQIVNSRDQIVPIPKVPMLKKVVAFKHILIRYIDQNVVDFLRLFRRTFASCGIFLEIKSAYDNGALKLIMHNIWPLIKDNICEMDLGAAINFYFIRQYVPSLLSECPSLRILSAVRVVFPAFPSDDSAKASEGQLVAKWLLSPPLLVDGAPRIVQCKLYSLEHWSSKIDPLKTAFSNASSRANFIIVTTFLSYQTITVAPFELINNSTGEQLTLVRRTPYCHGKPLLLLVRCPIARDEQKWANWEEEAIKWLFINPFNQITVHLSSH